MGFFKRQSESDAPESVLLSGFESEQSYERRTPDWESDAPDVASAIAAAAAWVGTSERQVEVIAARGGSGRVIAIVNRHGTEKLG